MAHTWTAYSLRFRRWDWHFLNQVLLVVPYTPGFMLSQVCVIGSLKRRGEIPNSRRAADGGCLFPWRCGRGRRACAVLVAEVGGGRHHRVGWVREIGMISRSGAETERNWRESGTTGVSPLCP